MSALIVNDFGVRWWRLMTRPLSRSIGMITPIPAEELDLPISLESQDAPPIVFLLVYPTIPMEGGVKGVGCIRVKL
jgi:hypothetical protein